MVLKYPNSYDDDFINTFKKTIDVLNQLARRMQDLVAKGQLTEEQYAQLIITINGHLKSGGVDFHDLNDSTKNKILDIDQRVLNLIKGLDGTQELYTPINLEEYMTINGEEWVI